MRRIRHVSKKRRSATDRLERRGETKIDWNWTTSHTSCRRERRIMFHSFAVLYSCKQFLLWIYPLSDGDDCLHYRHTGSVIQWAAPQSSIGITIPPKGVPRKSVWRWQELDFFVLLFSCWTNHLWCHSPYSCLTFHRSWQWTIVCFAAHRTNSCNGCYCRYQDKVPLSRRPASSPHHDSLVNCLAVKRKLRCWGQTDI